MHVSVCFNQYPFLDLIYLGRQANVGRRQVDYDEHLTPLVLVSLVFGPTKPVET